MWRYKPVSQLWEVEEEGSEAQGWSYLQGKFKASLGYMKLCFKKKERKNNQGWAQS